MLIVTEEQAKSLEYVKEAIDYISRKYSDILIGMNCIKEEVFQDEKSENLEAMISKVEKIDQYLGRLDCFRFADTAREQIALYLGNDEVVNAQDLQEFIKRMQDNICKATFAMGDLNGSVGAVSAAYLNLQGAADTLNRVLQVFIKVLNEIEIK